MITERVGDLLAQPDLTHIAHQANLFHTFGAGLARAIAAKYPAAEWADRQTPYGLIEKLGTYSVGIGLGHPAIINLYTQRGLGGTQHDQTDYIAMKAALRALEVALRMVWRHDQSIVLGLPYKLGCGLAGGNWGLVRPIIEATFAESLVPVAICRRPEDN